MDSMLAAQGDGDRHCGHDGAGAYGG